MAHRQIPPVDLVTHACRGLGMSYTWWKTGIGDGYQPKHEKMRKKRFLKINLWGQHLSDLNGGGGHGIFGRTCPGNITWPEKQTLQASL